MPSPLADGLAYLHATEETSEFRGAEYRYTRLFYVCDETGERFTTQDADNHNVEQVYGPYRERYGIPAPHELTMFRKSLELSAAVMSKLLGFGPNQWTRYEQGEVPNRANGLLLRLAVRNPEAWQSLLEAGKSFFSDQPRLYARLRAKVGE
jgi:putative zinc finger/helix-turn-helix YgiT family protein